MENEKVKNYASLAVNYSSVLRVTSLIYMTNPV